MGELIVYQSLRCPSVHRPTFLNIFSSEITGPLKLKFHIETHLDAGMKGRSNGAGHMTQDGRIAHIW